MQTLAMILEYDGSVFSGWQVQPDTLTVQGSLEKALKNIAGYNISVVGAGRTDAGVHAAGQAAQARLSQGFPVRNEKIVKAVNSNLPKEIRILKALITKKEFHARFDASAREYKYNAAVKESVFNNHFAAYFRYPFNPDILNEAAKIFTGEHDFTTFSKFNPDTKNYKCKVETCRWITKNNLIHTLTIKADRFVYGMVRSLVGAMYDAARGKRTIRDLEVSLTACDRQLSSPLAEPQGLMLNKIFYPDDKNPFNN